MSDTNTFILVMGAKFLNCSISCSTHNPCAPPGQNDGVLDGVVYKVGPLLSSPRGCT
jgi:hypothetical protein